MHVFLRGEKILSRYYRISSKQLLEQIKKFLCVMWERQKRSLMVYVCVAGLGKLKAARGPASEQSEVCRKEKKWGKWEREKQ